MRFGSPEQIGFRTPQTPNGLGAEDAKALRTLVAAQGAVAVAEATGDRLKSLLADYLAERPALTRNLIFASTQIGIHRELHKLGPAAAQSADHSRSVHRLTEEMGLQRGAALAVVHLWMFAFWGKQCACMSEGPRQPATAPRRTSGMPRESSERRELKEGRRKGAEVDVAPEVPCPRCGASYAHGSTYCRDCRVALGPPRTTDGGDGTSGPTSRRSDLSLPDEMTPTPPPEIEIVPGRWSLSPDFRQMGQLGAMAGQWGVNGEFILTLEPSGQFSGQFSATAMSLQIPATFNGRWGYEPAERVLTVSGMLQLQPMNLPYVGRMLATPPQQFTMSLRITGGASGQFQAFSTTEGKPWIVRLVR